MNQLDFNTLLTQTKLLLPPMCGYTDYPYRRILAKFGGKILCTEMVKARAILIGNERSIKMLAGSKEGAFTGVQLLGFEPEVMAKAALFCREIGFSFVDINLGCPVKKIVSKKEGGALLKDSEQIKRILQAVRKVLDIPLTIKMRLGFYNGQFNALPIAKMAEDIGVNAITIHGRSVEQGYGGLPDLVKIREVAEAVKIPVIANGGIKNGAIAKEVLGQTRSAAIMPGRAILGNPWLIDEILFHLDDRPIEHHRTISAIKETALEHFEIMAQFYDERTACLCMRKFLSLYFTGVIGVLMMRKKLSDLNNRCSFISLLNQFDDQMGFIGHD